MANATLLEKVMKLSDPERVELLVQIWHSLSREVQPVTDEEKAYIECRLAEHRAKPSETTPLSKVRDRLKNRAK